MSPHCTGRSMRFASLCFALALITNVGCEFAPKQQGIRTVAIDSSPTEATITINGQAYGQTPVTLRNIAPGKTLVVLTKDGFKRTAKLITVTELMQQRFLIEMDPMLGYVNVDSKPPGATVILNGFEILGETPLIRAPVPVGKHKYIVRKDNYKEYEGEVNIAADLTYTFAHDLIPKEANVSILSRPSSAKVWINEEPRPESTPAKIMLVPGEYTVKVWSRGYLTAEQNIAVGPNEEKNVEFDLKPGDAPFGMILVPAGKFIMGLNGGAPDERPQREVHLDAFYIDKNEVTNAEYKAVFPTHNFKKGHEQEPVTGVSWVQASDYAKAVGKRLPTEEEWEKAARGTDGREFPWGMEFDKDLCNFNGSNISLPSKVGSFRRGASPFGCADMAGNVYEWTSNWYQAYPGNTDVKTEYGQIYRVLRGGSYLSDRFGVRCARRHFDRMDAARADYGFRCAKDVESGSVDGKKT